MRDSVKTLAAPLNLQQRVHAELLVWSLYRLLVLLLVSGVLLGCRNRRVVRRDERPHVNFYRAQCNGVHTRVASGCQATSRLPEDPLRRRCPFEQLRKVMQMEKILKHFIAPVISGVVVSVVLVALSPLVISRIEDRLRPPTCQDPKELQRLPVAMIDVEVKSFEDEEGWPAANLIDGDPGTAWVPDRADDPRRATFRFEEPVDLRLVCVVNGNGGSGIGYKRADRLRTVNTVTEQSGDPVQTNLRDLPEGDVNRLQQVQIVKGRTQMVQIDIVASWPGLTVFEPRDTEYLRPTRLIAFGEAEFYRE